MTDTATHPHPPYGHILVPLDGSRQAERALDEAIALASSQGGSLRLLSVLDEMQYVDGFEPSLVVIDDVLPRARREIGAMLESARARAAARGVAAEVALETEGTADIPQVVCAQAQAWPADLVVLGTHGRRGVERMLAGSVAEAILRRCPAPVLLVRTEDDADAPSTSA